MDKRIKELFEDYLINNLPKYNSFHPIFNDALSYSLKAGGKRFRPLLLLNVVYSKNELLINSSMPVALAIEILHTYSLIHDDIPAMDNATYRRGKLTLHKKYDEVTAILVGDALNTISFYYISNAPLSDIVKVKLIKELSLNGGLDGMVIGQAIDCYFENKKLDLKEVEFLHIHKTAKLIAVSLKMGAIIANYDNKTIDNLYQFGIKLGLLFQVQDDILDATKTTDELGKDSLNDIDKNSFVNLLGLDKAIQYANNLASECENILSTFDTNLKQNLKILLLDYLYRHS